MLETDGKADGLSIGKEAPVIRQNRTDKSLCLNVIELKEQIRR
jgi:hypothetical protein